MLQNLAELL